MPAASPKSLKTPYAAALAISAIAFLVVFSIRYLGWLNAMELGWYDWMIRAQPPAAASERVTLLTITETDIQTLGSWPVPNATLAEALAKLLALKPRAIGIDIYLDVPVPPGREALEALLTQHQNIVVAMKFPGESEPGVPPPSVLQGSEQTGFTDLVVDRGGIARRGLLFQNNESMFGFSLALRLALHYLAAEGIGPTPDPEVPEHMRLGQTTIAPFEANDGSYIGAAAGGYQFLIDYRARPGTLPTLSLLDVLEGRIPPELVNDRVVLVGVAAESVKDFFYTPYSADPSYARVMPGVELHGHIINQLLRFALEGDRPLRFFNEWLEGLWLALWGVLGGLLGLLVRSPLRFTLAVAAGLGLLFGGLYLAFRAGWWLPAVPPAIAWVIAATIVTAYVSYREVQERSKLMTLFSRHISHQLAVDIWEHRDQFLAGGHPHPQKLTATAFFSDVAGFTTISEQLEPRELMDWLSEYMGTMTPILNEHNGVILRFIGDAIMAVFGVPIPRLNEAEITADAVRSVDCALKMKRTLIEYNRQLQAQGRPLVAMRVGIYTGPMVAGSIGDADRLEYNVHGDAVNTAARLESFEKEKWVADPFVDPCRIFIGEGTLERIGAGYETELVGEVQLKGKEEYTRIYRVDGQKAVQPEQADSSGQLSAALPVEPSSSKA